MKLTKLMLAPLELVIACLRVLRALAAETLGRVGLGRVAEQLYLFELRFRPHRRAAILAQLAFYYDVRHRESRAIQCFNEVLAINPNDTAAYVELGDLYERTGDKESARASLQRALSLGGFNDTLRRELQKKVSSLS